MATRSKQSRGKGVATTAVIEAAAVPGLTLRHVLSGHSQEINRIAWSPDGNRLASPSADMSVRIWDTQSGDCLGKLTGHTDAVNSVAWSPDGRLLASASSDGTIRIWDLARDRSDVLLKCHDKILDIAWSSRGRLLSAARFASGVVEVWDAIDRKLVRELTPHAETVYKVAWSPDGALLASASWDNAVAICEAIGTEPVHVFKDHRADVNAVAWDATGRMLVSGDERGRIIVWDVATATQIVALEGHTGQINSLGFSCSNRVLVSKSRDSSVRFWDATKWAPVGTLEEAATVSSLTGLAFHPKLPLLATLGEDGETDIRIWDVDETVLLRQTQASAHYTTAKIVLVGDSGVGKTGLGWRLANDEYKEHDSTHGQQFWPIRQLGLERADGTTCEAVLWDLAGQHVYRQIHSIFLENVSAALVLFDGSNRQDPLKGVQFWLEQLKDKGTLPPAVLIGARVDRGAAAMARADLDQFCQHHGIRGGYVGTSAKSGEGLADLLAVIKAQIPWDAMTATVTTTTFKRIKDHVLALKEQPDRSVHVLVGPAALRAQLQATDSAWHFSDTEMMTAVRHLETHGYVTVLCSSGGDTYVLLAPELLVTLASSIVLAADKHPRELGAVSEAELLQGVFRFDELAGLGQAQAHILLDAAALRFLQHNICFRESLDDATLLIFPGLIKQKRPLQDDLPAADDISYVVRGRVENLYASLAVLLGYTTSFTRINQWQNQAQYEMPDREICGFRLIEDREGEIELVLYYSDRMPAAGRARFQELFERFLHQRDVEVTRFPLVVCTQGHRQKRATVIERARENKRFMFCDECGGKIALPDLTSPQGIGIAASPWLQREEAMARLRSAYEVHLTRIKSYRRTWATPRCWISHLPEQAAWAGQLAADLRAAGIYVVDQASEVGPDETVVVVETSAYREAFATPALAAQAPIVKDRLAKGRRLISLALAGRAAPHDLRDCEPGSFCDATHYPLGLFDLVLNLYAIPFTHAGFAPLREALHAQWRQSLTASRQGGAPAAARVFISYAHADEAFKDELVAMLAGLQRRGVVDAWHDRRIEPGSDWHQDIDDAMASCDLALLLVSADYLASSFIQASEQPVLMQRLQDMKASVIPIIVRPCPWSSEPLLRRLQALPQDGHAVITFAKDTGARDQVWTDIAAAVEDRAGRLGKDSGRGA